MKTVTANRKTLILHTQEQTLTIGFDGAPLLMEALQLQGLRFAHPCGGRGVCKQCAVEARGDVSPPDDLERQSGVRLSCRMRLLGDCEVTLRELSGFETQTEGESPAGTPLLLATDVGTTTLEIRLFNAITGAPVAGASALNPQVVFAADVIGRISAALEGKGDALKRLLQIGRAHV